MAKDLKVIHDFGFDVIMDYICSNYDKVVFADEKDLAKFCKTLEKTAYSLAEYSASNDDDIRYKSIVAKRKLTCSLGSLEKEEYSKVIKFIKQNCPDLKSWNTFKVPRTLIKNPKADDGSDEYLTKGFYSLHNRYDSPIELFEELRNMYLVITKHLNNIMEKLSPISLHSLIYFNMEHYMND